jgi:hypothetical protein
MPIVQLQSARDLTELAQRLYGLDAHDPRVAQAVKVLAAANPALPRDLSALPPTAPIVAPMVSGLAMAPPAVSAMPQHLDLLSLVRYVAEASEKIVAAAQAEASPTQDTARAEMLERITAALPAFKPAPSAPQQLDPHKLTAQLQVLTDNAAAFLKHHGG